MEHLAQLIEALHRLSNNALQVAKLIEGIPIIAPPTETVNINPKLTVSVADLTALSTVTCYNAPNCMVQEGNKVLEVALNKSKLQHNARIKSLHLIYEKDPIEVVKWDNIKILQNIDKADVDYDLIFLNEILEFMPNPINFLLSLKQKLEPNGKIFVRFRPWPASHGGFSEDNIPYGHILLPKEQLKVQHPVVNKITRPIQTYNNYIVEAGLSIISTQIHRYTAPLPEKFFKYVTNNIWGTISEMEAKKLLAIHNIDYLLGK